MSSSRLIAAPDSLNDVFGAVFTSTAAFSCLSELSKTFVLNNIDENFPMKTVFALLEASITCITGDFGDATKSESYDRLLGDFLDDIKNRNNEIKAKLSRQSFSLLHKSDNMNPNTEIEHQVLANKTEKSLNRLESIKKEIENITSENSMMQNRLKSSFSTSKIINNSDTNQSIQIRQIKKMTEKVNDSEKQLLNSQRSFNIMISKERQEIERKQLEVEAIQAQVSSLESRISLMSQRAVPNLMLKVANQTKVAVVKPTQIRKVQRRQRIVFKKPAKPHANLASLSPSSSTSFNSSAVSGSSKREENEPENNNNDSAHKIAFESLMMSSRNEKSDTPSFRPFMNEIQNWPQKYQDRKSPYEVEDAISNRIEEGNEKDVVIVEAPSTEPARVFRLSPHNQDFRYDQNKPDSADSSGFSRRLCFPVPEIPEKQENLNNQSENNTNSGKNPEKITDKEVTEINQGTNQEQCQEPSQEQQCQEQQCQEQQYQEQQYQEQQYQEQQYQEQQYQEQQCQEQQYQEQQCQELSQETLKELNKNEVTEINEEEPIQMNEETISKANMTMDAINRISSTEPPSQKDNHNDTAFLGTKPSSQPSSSSNSSTSLKKVAPSVNKTIKPLSIENNASGQPKYYHFVIEADRESENSDEDNCFDSKDDRKSSTLPEEMIKMCTKSPLTDDLLKLPMVQRDEEVPLRLCRMPIMVRNSAEFFSRNNSEKRNDTDNDDNDNDDGINDLNQQNFIQPQEQEEMDTKENNKIVAEKIVDKEAPIDDSSGKEGVQQSSPLSVNADGDDKKITNRGIQIKEPKFNVDNLSVADRAPRTKHSGINQM